MVRRSFRLGLWVGLLFGIGFALYKTMQGRRAAQETVRPPIEGPGPVRAAKKAPAKKAPAKKAAAKKAAGPPTKKWVEPVSPDMCPDSHPIKAKLSSKLFHLPGMFAYPRTKPDRCYDT